MGRYVPPDLEGFVSSNAASGKGHALGSRARKLKSEGILTIRFECPFAIWCTTCSPEQVIGQGVRFNAEKKKAGMYFSSPIWSFRFKHTACGGWIEVRTDPKSAEYIVVEGGRRRDYGLDKDDGERVGVSEEEKARLEKAGGFGALEKKVEDKSRAEKEKERIEELMLASQRDWEDPYKMSRKLRREFRVGRRKRQGDERTGEALKQKFGLGVEMLAGTEEDGERVRYIEFGEQEQEEVGSVRKPMFQGSSDGALSSRSTSKSTSKASSTKVDKKDMLGSKLRDNTRIASDPFLREEEVWQPRVKRKRHEEVPIVAERDFPKAESSTSKALVGYDSDSS